MAAIRRAEDIAWDPLRIQASAERFSEDAFRSGLRALADELVAR